MWEAANEPWRCAFPPAVAHPAQAAMATLSRCANQALSEQIRQAHSGAMRVRDCARAAAALAAAHLPPGPARDALVDAWSRQEADAERMMHEVLSFGREHGHAAFAFPVYS
jgi:hypothetical protein